MTAVYKKSGLCFSLVDATEKSVLGFLYDPAKTFLQVAVTLKNSHIDIDINHDITAEEVTV